MVDLARDGALEVLRRVATQGAFAGTTLRTTFARAESRDVGLATELVYGVLRRRAQLDRALSRLGRRLKDIDPKLHDVLRLGAYQLMFLERVPAHAAVSAAVDQARARRGEKGAAQVNAILRKLSDLPQDQRLPPAPPLSADPVQHVMDVGGLPRTIAALWVEAVGAEAARGMALASLERAPLVLRTNLRRTTREALQAEVEGEPGAHRLAVHLPARLGALPADLLAVAEGRATPQDEASMHVIDLLAPEPGERVLDVCAAPGGKTTAIGERLDDRGLVVAHDRATEKLPGIRASAERLGLSCVQVVPVLPRLEDPPFDRVLVDAPCSGLGTLRRHPEIRWRFRDEDLERLVRIQRGVLAEGAARVRVGGTLVYSVCTVTAHEGPGQLEGAECLAGFERVDERHTGPHEAGAPDGFYAAKLVRRR